MQPFSASAFAGGANGGGAALVGAHVVPFALADAIVTTVRGFEALRELATYLTSHACPPPPPPRTKSEEEEDEEEGDGDGEGEGGDGAAALWVPRGPAVAVDRFAPASSVVAAVAGTPAERAALATQAAAATAVSPLRYRASLLVDRPQLQAALAAYVATHALDAILYPTTPQPAAVLRGPEAALVAAAGDDGALVDATALYTRNARLAAAAGWPAISVPTGLTTPTPSAPRHSPAAERLPLGVEFMAAPGRDAHLLRIAAAFQALAPLVTDPVVVRRWNEAVTA